MNRPIAKGENVIIVRMILLGSHMHFYKFLRCLYNFYKPRLAADAFKIGILLLFQADLEKRHGLIYMSTAE
jgi:hypothetical protein